MRINLQSILLLLFLFNSFASTAQEVEPRFAVGYISFLFSHLDTFHYNDNNITDTIDGQLWTGIYSTGFAEGSSSNNSELRLHGYYRKEDRRVYYTNTLRSGLLYDFNLEAGEEARVVPWGGPAFQRDTTVYLVDSVKYMNCAFDDSVKVMYVTSYFNYPERQLYWRSNVWIEGIGDTQHPFPPESCFSGDSCEGLNRWSKYYLNGTWYELWNAEGTAQLPCEEIITSTRSPVLNLPIQLSPNPNSPGMELTIEAGDFSVEKVSLIGLADGRLVTEWAVMPSGNVTVTIPSTVTPGVYVLLLTDRGGRVAREKVVVR